MTQKKKKSWEYFDDCAVCQAVREAEEGGEELSLNELQAAFKKAKKRDNKKD